MSLIYIVEDDENIQEIESYALKSTGFEVDAFQDDKELSQACQKQIPDLIVLDRLLPNCDGLKILEDLKNNQKLSKVPVIIVSALGSEMDKVKGLDLGADDYLAKPFGVMEFISRVKANLRKKEDSPYDSLKYREIEMIDEKHLVLVNQEIVELTYKEYELLKLFLSNQGRVLSRDLIMERVWDSSFVGESRTVDMHIKTLRKKLKDCGNYIKTIRHIGYILE